MYRSCRKVRIYISFYLLPPSHELQQDMGCPNSCVLFLDAIHGANREHPRRWQLSHFPFQACSEDVLILYAE